MDHLKLAKQFLQCKTADLVLVGIAHWNELTKKEKKKAFKHLKMAAEREQVFYRRFTGSLANVHLAERKVRKAYREYTEK